MVLRNKVKETWRKLREANHKPPPPQPSTPPQVRSVPSFHTISDPTTQTVVISADHTRPVATTEAEPGACQESNENDASRSKEDESVSMAIFDPPKKEQQALPCPVRRVTSSRKPRTVVDPKKLGPEYWGPIQNVGHEKLVALVSETLPENTSWEVIKECSGAFNHSYILRSAKSATVNVRVPACGFGPRWNGIDARLLKDTALGMEYVRKTTGLPIPRLLSCDDTFNNAIGAPYILMSYIEGKPLTEAWNPLGDEEAGTVRARRLKILNGLAKLVVKLETTKFSSFGALGFDLRNQNNPEITITGAWRLSGDNIFMVQRKFHTLPIASSIQELLEWRRQAAYEMCCNALEKDYGPHFVGMRRDNDAASFTTQDATKVGYLELYEAMIEAFLKVAVLGPEEKHFVLMQSDFNPQNILVDEDSNVVGLIDWDCLEAIPRQVGWCSVPHWLLADWSHEWEWPSKSGALAGMMPDEYQYYRDAYCEFLQQVCAGRNKLSDHRFASKSDRYRALLSAHESSEHMEALVCNVMADIFPRSARSIEQLSSRLVMDGIPDAEAKWLQERFEEYFKPL